MSNLTMAFVASLVGYNAVVVYWSVLMFLGNSNRKVA